MGETRLHPEMQQLAAAQSRDGVVQAGFRSLVEGVDFLPERGSFGGPVTARTSLHADDTVIFTGWPVRPGSAVSDRTAS